MSPALLWRLNEENTKAVRSVSFTMANVHPDFSRMFNLARGFRGSLGYNLG